MHQHDQQTGLIQTASPHILAQSLHSNICIYELQLTNKTTEVCMQLQS